MKRASLMIAALALLCGVGQAKAGTITTTNNTNALDLANALTSGGAGGITITGETLSYNSSGNAASSGTFSTSGTNGYNLSGSGIVLTSGNAAADGTSGPFSKSITTAYGTNATSSQTNLLNQVSSAPGGFHDVTELTITFDVSASTKTVYFNAVFGSAEYPVYVNSYIDGFGMFLNGTNIAYVGGDPVNINSPYMVNTGYPVDGGVDGSQYQTTPLGGLLVYNGNPVVTYSGSVNPGSTGNTLTFIIADANDSQLDSTVFIEGLGNAAPPTTSTPEPASVSLLGLGAVGLIGYARRRRVAVTA